MKSPRPLKLSEARNIVQALNRVDLDQADYGYIKAQVDRLIIGNVVHAITLGAEARLYRGVVHDRKPDNVNLIGSPPAILVKDYQRCNRPNCPMFYCSVDPAAVFYELAVQPGQKLYFSKWSRVADFAIAQIAPRSGLQKVDRRGDIVNTFFETKFAQPVHGTYSSQYKITSAIAEHYSQGDTGSFGREMGAISYPSVSHPLRSENLAIRPEIVARCLKLDYVEEVIIDSVVGKEIKYTRLDFASVFSDDSIEWTGKILHWNVRPNSSILLKAEPDGWIARDEHGVVVNPG